jgi:flagellar hook-associated protein 3 FlgL
MMYDKNTYNISKNASSVARLSNAVSSGKTLLKASDDATAWSKSLDIKQTMREVDAYQANMDFAEGWGKVTEDALTGIYDLLDDARETAIAASKPLGDEEREAYVATLNQLIQEAVDLANTKYEDRYIFSINGESAPFSIIPGEDEDAEDVDAAADPDDAEGDEVQSEYVGGVTVNGVDVINTDSEILEDTLDISGMSDTLSVRVSQSSKEIVNVDGQEIFWSDSADLKSNIFQQLYDLREAVEAEDTETIQTLQTDLEGAQSRISSQISLTGTRLSALERRQSVLVDMETEYSSRLGELEEGDLVGAISQLTQKQTLYDAALQVTGMLDGLSLLKYI